MNTRTVGRPEPDEIPSHFVGYIKRVPELDPVMVCAEQIEETVAMLRGLSEIDVTSTILGAPVSYPLVLAPTGFTRLVDPEGELAVARAAARAELPYTLSTLSTRSIEESSNGSSLSYWASISASTVSPRANF